MSPTGCPKNKTNRSNDAKLESSILDKVLNEQNLDMHSHLKTYPVSHKEVGITTNNSNKANFFFRHLVQVSSKYAGS